MGRNINLSEGMRRIGLLICIVGAILGTIVAVMGAAELIHRYKDNKRFEALVGSPEAKEITFEKVEDSWALKGDYFKYVAEPPNAMGIQEVGKSKSDGGGYVKLESGELIYKRDFSFGDFVILLSPIFGYLIPWCVIRVITWIIRGFTKAPLS
jgi:hypothetical protein